MSFLNQALNTNADSNIYRAKAFFQGTAAYLIAGVLAIPFSWYLMKKSSFVPMTISIGFLFLGMLVVFFLPETLDRSHVPDPAEGTSGSDPESGDEGGLLDLPKKKSVISVIVRKAEESRFIFASPMLIAVAISFLVQSTHAFSIQLLFQFASERFHWSLADVSFHARDTPHITNLHFL